MVQSAQVRQGRRSQPGERQEPTLLVTLELSQDMLQTCVSHPCWTPSVGRPQARPRSACPALCSQECAVARLEGDVVDTGEVIQSSEAPGHIGISGACGLGHNG